MSEAAGGAPGGGGAPRAVHVGVLADPERRGPEAVLDAWFSLGDVAGAVAAAGADVTVVQAGVRDATLRRDGVRYRFVPTPVGSTLRRAAGFWAAPLPGGLVEAVRAARPDVVHFHSLSFPRHVKALTRGLPGVPVLVQDHADAVPGPWLRPLHRWGLAGVAGAAFTAVEQAEPFLEAGVLPRGLPVFGIPEASSRFEPGDPGAARAATGLGGDPCLLWLGNLDANKDPLTVLEAVARAVPRLPDARLWMAYRHDTLADRVRARIAGDERLDGRVRLLGRQPRERVELLLRAADLLVQGSHREGSGYAVLEALACGTTPLVTDIPSFRALTGDGAVGGLFPPGDPEALARLLVDRAGEDPAARRRAARRHFEEHLGPRALGRKLLGAYRAVAGAGP